MCFDVPAVSQSTIYTTLCSQAVDPSLPYGSFAHILDELLRLYDNSVWSIRNHISRWEVRRTQEIDYVLLHEIARHGVHVNETLKVAARSLSSIRQHHERSRVEINLVGSKNKRRSWDTVGEHLEFQVRFLEGLAERSQANNARI
ncbi:hypothetical protein BDW02DRAFT_597908 [Decorospora gaudefroyi]|uniref:Uncharacterized protein n=1 Tax=Decorospora gaudefroyi TaxID=184978 RepID=A0A6A5KFW1_9PLEO|nr:hypothetical protein BDW02DRAFT_597908 [Decorospora gaudefroyi]